MSLKQIEIDNIAKAVTVPDYGWIVRIAKELKCSPQMIENRVEIAHKLHDIQEKLFKELTPPVVFNDERASKYELAARVVLSNIELSESFSPAVKKKQSAPKASVNPISVKKETPDSFWINPESKVQEIKKSKKEKGSVQMLEKLLGTELIGKVEGIGMALMTGQLAVPVEDKFFTFDKQTKEITDVTSLVAEIGLPAFKMPVLATQIEEGDLVVFNDSLVFVTEVTPTGRIVASNPVTSREETFTPIPVSILGGQTFVPKVQTFDLNLGGADSSNPMASMLPLMLLGGKEGLGGSLGGDDTLSTIMLMNALGGGNGASDMSSILPLLLLKDGGLGEGSDLTTLLMMQSLGGAGLGGLFGGGHTPAVELKTDEAYQAILDEVAKLKAENKDLKEILEVEEENTK